MQTLGESVQDNDSGQKHLANVERERKRNGSMVFKKLQVIHVFFWGSLLDPLYYYK